VEETLMKSYVDIIEPTTANPTSDGGSRLDVNFEMGPLDDNVKMVEGSTQAFVKNANLTIRLTIKQAKKLRRKLKKAILGVEFP
jgi:hypothetical protein